MIRRGFQILLTGAFVAGAMCPARVLACAACFGESDSPLARGMNWGIFSLLAVIVCVLGGVASFFVYLGRRASATVEPGGAAGPDE